MKIYYTGRGSRVGKALEKFGVRLLDCDVTSTLQVQEEISRVHPDMIIHLACKSDVDFCEREENKKLVIGTNFNGFKRVATVAEKYRIPVVVISSEHIFDGRRGNYREDTKLGEYKEGKETYVNMPVNFYGQTKLAVEAAAKSFPDVKVVRTSTLFDSKRGLIRKYLDPLKIGQAVEVPVFITRSFMYVPHFAEVLNEYARRFDKMPKVLNISGTKTISWYTFIYYLADVYKIDTNLVHPRKRELGGFDAPRPLHGGLDVRLSNQLGLTQYSYMDGLHKMFEDDTVKSLVGYD